MTRNYKTSYKSGRGLKRFKIAFGPSNPQPDNEIDRLRLEIKKNMAFIRKYPSYPNLCAQRRESNAYCRKRIKELRCANKEVSQ